MTALLAQGQQSQTLNGVGSMVLLVAALLVIAVMFGKKKK